VCVCVGEAAASMLIVGLMWLEKAEQVAYSISVSFLYVKL